MKPVCSILGLTLQNKSEALFRRDHIVMRYIISDALAALIGLMMPSFAVAADPVHAAQFEAG